MGRVREDGREAGYHKSGLQWGRTWQMRDKASEYLYARTREFTPMATQLAFVTRQNGATLT